MTSSVQVTWLHELPPVGSSMPHDDSACPDVFQSLRWFRHLASHGIDIGEGLWVASVTGVNGNPAWLLPLQLRRGAQASVFGHSLASLSNYYSSLFGPVGDPALVTQDGFRALARALRRPIPGRDVIDLQPLDQDAAFLPMLEAALQAEGYTTRRYFCFGNWYLPVQGRCWSEIEPQVESSQRNTVKRARKKLANEPGFSLEIVQQQGTELDAAIASYRAIYDRSWKRSEPFPEFVPGLCRWTAEMGWLRLGIVRVGDTPVAAQIWIVQGHRAMIFKLAYDESFKRLSAGSVLTAELMRHVIDIDRVTEVDYLTGDDAYKAAWMSHRRERVGLLAFYPFTIAGLAALLRNELGRWRARWRATRSAPVVQAENKRGVT